MPDREKVIEGLRRCTEKATPNCFRCPYSCHCEEGDTWVIKDDALKLLKEQNIRRDGRWKSIPHKKARVCSVCEKDEPYKFADDDADVYAYCPHCGAKMEGW